MHTSSRFVVQNESIPDSFFHHKHCNPGCPLQCFPTRTVIFYKCIILVHTTNILIVVLIQYEFPFISFFSRMAECIVQPKKISFLSCQQTIKTFPSYQNVNSACLNFVCCIDFGYCNLDGTVVPHINVPFSKR